MKNQETQNGGPVIRTQNSPEEIAWAKEQLRKHLAARQAECVPLDELELLRSTALGDTGGSRAARNILRWLWAWHGGLELRALDGPRQRAALRVMHWWAGPVHSHDPLGNVIDEIECHWPKTACPMCRRSFDEEGK